MIKSSLCIFFEEYYRRDFVPFSLHHIEGRLITLSLSTSDVNFDHLLKLMSASFCPVKLLFFFLCNLQVFHEEIL